MTTPEEVRDRLDYLVERIKFAQVSKIDDEAYYALRDALSEVQTLRELAATASERIQELEVALGKATDQLERAVLGNDLDVKIVNEVLERRFLNIKSGGE